MARVLKGKDTSFKLTAPQAKRVSLAGSFNNWDINACTSKKDTRGNWTFKVNLKPGKYEYKFFVDGSWLLDPKCKINTYNNFGSQNSVVEVK